MVTFFGRSIRFFLVLSGGGGHLPSPRVSPSQTLNFIDKFLFMKLFFDLIFFCANILTNSFYQIFVIKFYLNKDFFTTIFLTKFFLITKPFDQFFFVQFFLYQKKSWPNSFLIINYCPKLFDRKLKFFDHFFMLDLVCTKSLWPIYFLSNIFYCPKLFLTKFFLTK